MQPYYDHAGIAIYHGDCRTYLESLTPGIEFDLLLTDPPYGLGDRWSGGGTWQDYSGIYAEARAWDRHPVSLELLNAWIRTATTSIIWGGNYYALRPSRCWLAWIKAQRMDNLADFELAWTSLDAPARAYYESRNPDGKRAHPTQKPESVMRWCIGLAPEARLIIDPFMGSGTTLRAAKDLGRRAVGIEREERYCALAVDRLSQEALPLRLQASSD